MHDVPPAAALCLTVLHGIAVALAPGCSLRVTSPLYDNLRGAALFSAPGSALAPDAGGALDETRGCPPSALAQTDRFAVVHVLLQVLYKQVASLLPNVQFFTCSPCGFSFARIRFHLSRHTHYDLTLFFEENCAGILILSARRPHSPFLSSMNANRTACPPPSSSTSRVAHVKLVADSLTCGRTSSIQSTLVTAGIAVLVTTIVAVGVCQSTVAITKVLIVTTSVVVIVAATTVATADLAVIIVTTVAVVAAVFVTLAVVVWSIMGSCRCSGTPRVLWQLVRWKEKKEKRKTYLNLCGAKWVHHPCKAGMADALVGFGSACFPFLELARHYFTNQSTVLPSPHTCAPWPPPRCGLPEHASGVHASHPYAPPYLVPNATLPRQPTPHPLPLLFCVHPSFSLLPYPLTKPLAKTMVATILPPLTACYCIDLITIDHHVTAITTAASAEGQYENDNDVTTLQVTTTAVTTCRDHNGDEDGNDGGNESNGHGRDSDWGDGRDGGADGSGDCNEGPSQYLRQAANRCLELPPCHPILLLLVDASYDTVHELLHMVAEADSYLSDKTGTSWYQLVQAKKSYQNISHMGKSHQGTSTTVMVAVAVAVVIGLWGRDRIVPHRMEDHKGLEALARCVGTCVVGRRGGRAGWRGGGGVAWRVVAMVTDARAGRGGMVRCRSGWQQGHGCGGVGAAGRWRWLEGMAVLCRVLQQLNVNRKKWAQQVVWWCSLRWRRQGPVKWCSWNDGSWAMSK
ncbi:hypothetical protein EDB83DRAFT_2318390 [Lactarius deliciosus]|nr:hypothetical protein EDB83DRAFT_2318390 [Lactarius deliciosus]